MTLTFLGAAGTVTGSMTVLETDGMKILVDCGLFQGEPHEELLNAASFDIAPSEIHCVILTHAHIDHSGRIPLLVQQGFSGKIYCTAPTAHLSEIMLKDSGKIQEAEAAWENKRRLRAGLEPIDPLYTVDDALNALAFLYPVALHTKIDLSAHTSFELISSGHLLGAASVVLTTRVDGVKKTIAFSGDVGNDTGLLEAPAETVPHADVAIVESTYGNRKHTGIERRAEELVDLILASTDAGGTVIIPAFAVGRTQELIFEINHFIATHSDDRVQRLKDIPFYLDSPMALDATELYKDHLKYMEGIVTTYTGNPFSMPNLHLVETTEGSIALNALKVPKVIISASGMCEGGRIRHHLKHNLWKRDTAVIFIGYQAEGTLGRALMDGAKRVQILDADVAVNASIHVIHGFSGHADSDHLKAWVQAIDGLSTVFLNHGEADARSAFAEALHASDAGYTVMIPEINTPYTVSSNG